MTSLGRAGIAPAILLAALTSVSSAAAQTNPKCAELDGNIVYGVGGSAQTPLIGQIASRVRGLSGANQLTVVYSDAAGACAVPKALAPTSPTLLTGAAWYWAAGNNTALACDLDAAGVEAQFGSMQNFWEFCPDVTGVRPSSVGDFEGPIGTTNLIVPVASSQTSISAEAAHFVFGFGNESAVEPWTDDNFLIIRNQNSAVHNYIAAAIDVPATAFKGQNAMTNGNAVNWVANVTNGKAPAPVGEPDQALGFVSGENAERSRDKVRTLAFQAAGQECAYWPDSSATAFDKINVRRGQYYLWGTAHLFAKVSGTESKVADIVDAKVKKLIGWLTFTEDAPAELPVLDLYIDNYNVPQCAMQVRRSADLGPIESFQPDEPCGCYYDFRATGRTSCAECTTSAAATRKRCNTSRDQRFGDPTAAAARRWQWVPATSASPMGALLLPSRSATLPCHACGLSRRGADARGRGRARAAGRRERRARVHDRCAGRARRRRARAGAAPLRNSRPGARSALGSAVIRGLSGPVAQGVRA